MQGKQVAIAAAVGAAILLVGLTSGYFLSRRSPDPNHADRIAEWRSIVDGDTDGEIEAAKADLETLKTIPVSGFSLKTGESRTEATFTITNTLDQAISGVVLWVEVKREGRTIADAKGKVGATFPGGLEPGETQTIEDVFIFGSLGHVDVTPSSQVTHELIAVLGSDDKPIVEAMALYR